MHPIILVVFSFFFNDTATTEIYTLSLHDALPILARAPQSVQRHQSERQRSPAAALPRRLTYRGTVLSNVRCCQRPRLRPGALACRRSGPMAQTSYWAASIAE